MPRTAVTNNGMSNGNDNTANNVLRDDARAMIAAINVVPVTNPRDPAANMTANAVGAFTCMRNNTTARTATSRVNATNNTRLNSSLPR